MNIKHSLFFKENFQYEASNTSINTIYLFRVLCVLLITQWCPKSTFKIFLTLTPTLVIGLWTVWNIQIEFSQLLATTSLPNLIDSELDAKIQLLSFFFLLLSFPYYPLSPPTTTTQTSSFGLHLNNIFFFPKNKNSPAFNHK